jgi:AraC family transcriptional activator of pobA
MHGVGVTILGENQTSPVRAVPFAPLPGWSAVAEIVDIETLRTRGGPAEFVAPQRPEFELVLQIRAGQTAHEVDFTQYLLQPADVLWVHAGQVQVWGDITAIEGRAMLIPPTTFDAVSNRLLERLGIRSGNHWRGGAPPGSVLDDGWAHLAEMAARLRAEPPDNREARDAALAHAALAVLFLLSGDEASGAAAESPHRDLFRSFQRDIEQHFSVDRSVASYARRLGYSERTLNRAARGHAGASAKELIDRRVILEAKRRLVHEAVAVERIAADLGFDDTSNFSKYFAHRVGRTPTGFRRASRRQT